MEAYACAAVYHTIPFEAEWSVFSAEQLIDLAAALQAPRVLIMPGAMETCEAAELAICSRSQDMLNAYMSTNWTIQLRKPGLIAMIEYAKTRGVQLTLEDYEGLGQPLATINQLAWFMHSVPGLCFTLDPGNFAFRDESALVAQEKLRKHIRALQRSCQKRYRERHFLQGARAMCCLRGVHAASRVIKKLKENNYHGYLAIEHFDVPDQLPAIAKSATYLNQFIHS